MNIEEEMVKVIADARADDDYDLGEFIGDRPLAAALMPLLNRVRAGAWSEGFAAGHNADHNSMWWPKNPYREEANYDR